MKKTLSRSLMSICPTNVQILYDKDYIKLLIPNDNIDEYRDFARSQKYLFKEAWEKEPEICLSTASDLLIRSLILKENLDYSIREKSNSQETT